MSQQMADDPLPSAGSADSASEVNVAEMEIAPNFEIFHLPNFDWIFLFIKWIKWNGKVKENSRKFTWIIWRRRKRTVMNRNGVEWHMRICISFIHSIKRWKVEPTAVGSQHPSVLHLLAVTLTSDRHETDGRIISRLSAPRTFIRQRPFGALRVCRWHAMPTFSRTRIFVTSGPNKVKRPTIQIWLLRTRLMLIYFGKCINYSSKSAFRPENI